MISAALAANCGSVLMHQERRRRNWTPSLRSRRQTASSEAPNAAASEAPSQLALGRRQFQLAQIVGSGGEGCAWIQWHASAAYPQPPAFVRAKSQISPRVQKL